MSVVACVRAVERPREFFTSIDGSIQASAADDEADLHTIVAWRLETPESELADPERTCVWLRANEFDAVTSPRALPRGWQRALSNAGIAILHVAQTPSHARFVDLTIPWNEGELAEMFGRAVGRAPWIEAHVPDLPRFEDLEASFRNPEDRSIRLAFRQRETLEAAARLHRTAAWRGMIDAAHRHPGVRVVVEGDLTTGDQATPSGLDVVATSVALDTRRATAARVLGSEGARGSIRSLGIDVAERASDEAPRITICGDLRDLWKDGALFDRVLDALVEVRDHGGVLIFLTPPDRDNPLVRYGLLPAYELVRIDRALHAALPGCADALGLGAGSVPPAYSECLPRAAFLTTPTAEDLVVSIDLRGRKLGCVLFRESLGKGTLAFTTFQLLHSIDRYVAPRVLTRRFIDFASTWRGQPEVEGLLPSSIAGDARAWNAADVRERYERDRVQEILRPAPVR